jgi:putative permease
MMATVNNTLSSFWSRYVWHAEALWLLITAMTVLILFSIGGETVATLTTSIIIAYVLDGPVTAVMRMGLSRKLSVFLVLLAVVSLCGYLSAYWLPKLFKQLLAFGAALPEWLLTFNHFLSHHSSLSVASLYTLLQQTLLNYIRNIMRLSWHSITDGIHLIIHGVLMPMLVYFFLADKHFFLKGLQWFLPSSVKLLSILKKIDIQLGQYIRYRLLEMTGVALLTTCLLALFGLNYAILLGTCVGISVLIPYVGAIVMTIPIIAIMFLQWGLNKHFGYCLASYGALLIIDGNVIVPLLFSEAISLHPVWIMLAIIFFGQWFGFWGVFFAIPMAAIVKTCLHHWPVHQS